MASFATHDDLSSSHGAGLFCKLWRYRKNNISHFGWHKKYKIYKICLIIIYKTLVMILTLDKKSFLKNHPSMSFKEILL